MSRMSLLAFAQGDAAVYEDASVPASSSASAKWPNLRKRARSWLPDAASTPSGNTVDLSGAVGGMVWRAAFWLGEAGIG